MTLIEENEFEVKTEEILECHTHSSPQNILFPLNDPSKFKKRDEVTFRGKHSLDLRGSEESLLVVSLLGIIVEGEAEGPLASACPCTERLCIRPSLSHNSKADTAFRDPVEGTDPGSCLPSCF